MKFVQFEDDSETKIIRVFAGPQDPEWYPNQSKIDEYDERYTSFVAPPEIVDVSPVDKLKAFLLANPDVAEILS